MKLIGFNKMASERQKQAARSKTNHRRRVHPPRPVSVPEVVEPIWLVKAIGLTLVAALICGYLALCLLFYQGQWQLVLHPSHDQRAASLPGISSETIYFGIDESAIPQLTGIYIPAVSGARYASRTVLYLPSGDGQLADDDATLETLHNLGLNVLAFDYRGYGMSLRSNPTQSHPDQQRMTEDAASAWHYLTVSRGLKGGQIIPFGTGVGAALAAGLAASHPEVPVLLVDRPMPDLLAEIRRDPRTSSLPVSALFHERFEITTTLARLKTPKLLILRQGARASTNEGEATDSLQFARTAADPKFVLSLGPKSAPTMLPEALVRFLDQYLPQ